MRRKLTVAVAALAAITFTACDETPTATLAGGETAKRLEPTGGAATSATSTGAGAGIRSPRLAVDTPRWRSAHATITGRAYSLDWSYRLSAAPPPDPTSI